MPDEHPRYLTGEEMVETVYSHLLSGKITAAADHIRNQGDDKIVMKTWIGVQCDINNVKGDPYLSEQIAREGVKFALDKGYMTGAAMLLHNLSAFYMPNFDEDVDPKAIPGMVEAARQQVDLREQLEDKASLGWAYWDYAMTLLVAGRVSDAVLHFEKSHAVAESINDRDLAAWADLFKGKTWIKHDLNRLSEGEALMRESAATISEVGEDWEKAEVVKILATVGL